MFNCLFATADIFILVCVIKCHHKKQHYRKGHSKKHNYKKQHRLLFNYFVSIIKNNDEKHND